MHDCWQGNVPLLREDGLAANAVIGRLREWLASGVFPEMNAGPISKIVGRSLSVILHAKIDVRNLFKVQVNIFVGGRKNISAQLSLLGILCNTNLFFGSLCLPIGFSDLVATSKQYQSREYSRANEQEQSDFFYAITLIFSALICLGSALLVGYKGAGRFFEARKYGLPLLTFCAVLWGCLCSYRYSYNFPSG